MVLHPIFHTQLIAQHDLWPRGERSPRGAGDDGVVDLPSRKKTEKAVKLIPRDPQMGQGGFPWIRTGEKQKQKRRTISDLVVFVLCMCSREVVEAESPVIATLFHLPSYSSAAHGGLPTQ